MSPHLTKRRVRAILEALSARLAGEFDIDDARREDYEAAHEWAQEQLRRRTKDSGDAA